MSKSDLTATQQQALDIARSQGFVGPSDARLATVHRLEALGLVRVDARMRTWTSSRKRTRHAADWIAYPVAG